MNPTLEIFSQGEEIVTGQTVDSNAAWLSEQAVRMGFTVSRHTAVGDKLGDLADLLREISTRADGCLCTGGLGPTSDDLTAEAVAQAFNLPLAFDAIAYAQIGQFFKNRNRPMPEANRKQAMLPQGAIRLDNDWGTAPGFALQYGRCWFAFMPGVPYEMRQLFSASIRPILVSRFALSPGKLVTIKTVGIGESDIQQRIDEVPIPREVQLGFRAGMDEVQTKLLFPADFPKPEMDGLVGRVAGQLGEFVFAIDGLHEPAGDLAAVIDQLMRAGQHTLAVIETASQGLLAAKCIGAPWLLASSYEQSSARLAQKFAVTIHADDMMAGAKQLAVALHKAGDADFILVQLYAGNAALFEDKDKAIVLYNVLLTPDDCLQTTHAVAGPIKRKQNQAALLALDLLRRYLQHKEL